MNTESERGKAPKPSKKNLKKIKKGLDKIPNLWYNKDVSKREKKNPLLIKALPSLKGMRIWRQKKRKR
jgi:hypothetical protein